MADFLSALRSGLSGGLAASALAPEFGVPIALISGAAGLFGDDLETVRRKRKDALKAELQALRAKTLNTGVSRISQETAAMAGASRAAAASRALAAGNANDAESYIAPAEGKALSAGANAVRDFTDTTNQRFDAAEYGLEDKFSDRPIEPSVGQTLAELGEGVVKFAQDKKYSDALTAMYKNSTDVREGVDKLLPEQTPEGQQKMYDSRDQGLNYGEAADTELGGLPYSAPMPVGAMRRALTSLRWKG